MGLVSGSRDATRAARPDEKKRKRVTAQEYANAHSVFVHPKSPKQPTSAEWRQVAKSVRQLPDEVRQDLRKGSYKLYLTHGSVEKLTGDKRDVIGLAYDKKAYAEITPEWTLVVPHEIGHEADFSTKRRDYEKKLGEGKEHHVGPYPQWAADTKAQGESNQDFLTAVKRGYGVDWKRAFESWQRSPSEVWATLFSMYSSGRADALPPKVRDYFDERFGGV
jgi:hypothetical protein